MPEPAVFTETANRPTQLGESLAAKGLLGRRDLARALALQRERGERLSRILVDLGFVKPSDVLETQSEQLGIPLLHGTDFPADPPRIERIPAGYMRQYRFLPLAREGDRLRVAVADPLDLETVASIRSLTGLTVEAVLASESDILGAIEQHYDDRDASTSSPGEPSEEDIEQLRDMASEAPVIRYVNAMITRALDERASDIHLEPFDEEFRVRYRIDGVLENRTAPPRPLQAAVVSRLKLMSRLNIAERRLPQDGRMQMKVLGRDLDMRVATLPTLHGEAVVLRLLDRAASNVFELASLGLEGDMLSRMERFTGLHHGILLVTGPTGSGKTTTLHAVLKRINSPARKIVTIEDPVEYRIEGVNQIQVNPSIGLTFAAGLRHIVRQDPDVIMVGEIRDQETAEIAIRAALTGHSVYSTLHTNDAAGAITRLVDMGIETYLLASSLVAVLAQRLVRLLCVECREPAGTAAAPDGRWVPTWKAGGCEACRGQGYLGRVGIFELLEIDEVMRRLIVRNSPAAELVEAARDRGLRSLQHDGWNKIERGLTSLDEVLRATQEV